MAITGILVRLSFRTNFVTSNLSEKSPRRAKEPSDSFSGEPGSAGAPGCRRYQNSKLEMDGVQDLTCEDFKDFHGFSTNVKATRAGCAFLFPSFNSLRQVCRENYPSNY
jgi:hypothetical protein